MRNVLLILLTVFLSVSTAAQELNATVTVDATQTSQADLQLFRTLENELADYLNNTQFTSDEYLNQERIACNFTIIVNAYDTGFITGSMQIQSSRPAYNSTYNSPVYNYNDKQVAFEYTEFQPLRFNINSFDSNLMSLVHYHVYTLIGLDANTFQLNAGTDYFETAKQVVNTAASGGNAGWKPTDGNQSRFKYNDALLSPVYSEFNTALYGYHRDGIDTMERDPKQAKQNIAAAIAKLKNINDRRPNSYLIRTFFDAKADEIEAIYSGGPSVNITTLVTNLNRLAPTRRSNWDNIKF